MADQESIYDAIIERQVSRLDQEYQEERRSIFNAVNAVLENIKAPEWLIKGVIEKDSLMILYGEPGHGKSFLAMDMAACIAADLSWHSMPVASGAVFYIAGEGQNGIARRFSAWELHNDTHLNDTPLAVSSMSISLDDPEMAVRVRSEIETMAEDFGRDPVLIVIDTLARNFSGDENSSKDIGHFVRTLDALRQRWNATIIVVHHSGKNADRGARGSSALKAAADAEYSVAMDANKIVSLQSHKMKDAEPPPVMAFKLKGVELNITDEEGSPVWSCCPVLLSDDYEPPKRGSEARGKNQVLALQCLNDLYLEHQQRLEEAGKDPQTALVTIEDWRSRCATAGIKRQRFSEVKQSLADQSCIELINPYVKPTR